MARSKFRVERDSMGAMKVPAKALYGAQTQRNIENFPVSGIRFSRAFIRALGVIKASCAEANRSSGLLKVPVAAAIRKAAGRVAEGRYDEEFPIDIFQTGSGTNTNMNAKSVKNVAAASSTIQAKRPSRLCVAAIRRTT